MIPVREDREVVIIYPYIYIYIWDYGIIMGLSNGIHSIFESGIMIQRDF
jgi:hypothetical protein